MIAVERLLDTNFLISRWRDGKNSAAAKWLRDNVDLAVGLPWIVKGEFLRGAVVAGHAPGEVRSFLDRFPTAWPNDATLEIYATLFARLRIANTLPGPHDLWIAATAMQLGVPLVTRNTVQFSRIEGVTIESY
jgi:tRNA(fMet)-specific endonuclease VapC